jgi:hypothetical protein
MRPPPFLPAAALAAALLCTAVPGSAQPATGRLQGTVRGAPRSGEGLVPLSYAVVTVSARGGERLTDAGGRFAQDDLAAGDHEVFVRRLGYTPWRGTVAIRAGETTVLDVQLDLVPVRIQAVLTVQAMHRLVDFEAGRARYRPGRVVDRAPGNRRDEYQMTLPSVLDLADDAFARAHCFAFGGRETVEEETWFRLDVRAAERLNRPDVHGSFWLDSATVELRRMELELSRPDRLPTQFRGIAALQVHTRLVEIAPGLSIIGDVCALTRFETPPRSTASPPLLVELQQLIGYRFEHAPADVPAEVGFAGPAWQVGDRLPRETVWCLDAPR